MKKMAILLSTLVVSASSFALSSLPHALGSAVRNLAQTEAHATMASYPIIYGGQDISRPVVATANESVWTGHTTFVG